MAVQKGGSPWPKLIYSAITSLDGYIADEDGTLTGLYRTGRVHTFINDL